MAQIKKTSSSARTKSYTARTPKSALNVRKIKEIGGIQKIKEIGGSGLARKK
ncbi:MAG: hypothetical protein ABH871_01890 [Pseudomonadota bacterium]